MKNYVSYAGFHRFEFLCVAYACLLVTGCLSPVNSFSKPPSQAEGKRYSDLHHRYRSPIPTLPVTTTLTAHSPANVWSTFAAVAMETKAFNLGQGFPDWDPPQFMRDALIRTADTSFHQYTRPAGHLPLVELIAKRYTTHLNRPVDHLNEVAITVGASQGLFLALTTLVKTGDEVVVFEPFFELYQKQIKLTGATVKYVPLGSSNDAANADPWSLNIEALRRSINEHTKILIVNSPHNPTGKVFSQTELNAIAEIVRENPQLIVLSDEVYKFTVYDPLEAGDPSSAGHYHFARLPGMWDRTITISSCGKTFSATGWQVGWVVAPSKFVLPIQELLPCVQFCASTPVQHALTLALTQAELPYEGYSSYYDWLKSQFHSKRRIVEDGLAVAGIESLPSRGGFFLMGKLPYEKRVADRANAAGEPYDWQYCRLMARELGIVAIPASPFFTPGSEMYERLGPMARFAFCKKEETLWRAMDSLKLRVAQRNTSKLSL